MACWDHIGIDLPPVLIDEFVFFEDLLWELDLEEGVLVGNNGLTLFTEVEAFAVDALVADADDAVLVLALRTNDPVVDELADVL